MTEITARLTTALADRYRIEHELGAGGMATVYVASEFSCVETRARRDARVLKDARSPCPSGHVPQGPSPGFSRGITWILRRQTA